jgi:hypothetical protein
MGDFGLVRLNYHWWRNRAGDDDVAGRQSLAKRRQNISDMHDGTRIGPIFSGLFTSALMRRDEQRQFSPRLRASGTLLSRHKN